MKAEYKPIVNSLEYLMRNGWSHISVIGENSYKVTYSFWSHPTIPEFWNVLNYLTLDFENETITAFLMEEEGEGDDEGDDDEDDVEGPLQNREVLLPAVPPAPMELNFPNIFPRIVADINRHLAAHATKVIKEKDYIRRKPIIEMRSQCLIESVKEGKLNG